MHAGFNSHTNLGITNTSLEMNYLQKRIICDILNSPSANAPETHESETYEGIVKNRGSEAVLCKSKLNRQEFCHF